MNVCVVQTIVTKMLHAQIPLAPSPVCVTTATQETVSTAQVCFIFFYCYAEWLVTCGSSDAEIKTTRIFVDQNTGAFTIEGKIFLLDRCMVVGSTKTNHKYDTLYL